MVKKKRWNVSKALVIYDCNWPLLTAMWSGITPKLQLFVKVFLKNPQKNASILKELMYNPDFDLKFLAANWRGVRTDSN